MLKVDCSKKDGYGKKTNQEQMPYYLEKTGIVLWMRLHLFSPFPPLPLTLEFYSTVFPPALDSPVKELLY